MVRQEGEVAGRLPGQATAPPVRGQASRPVQRFDVAQFSRLLGPQSTTAS